MVYAYIIEEGVYQCEGSAKHGKTTRWQPKRHPASPAHLQDIENIGEPTLFELGLFYYQVTTFKFSGDASSQCRRLGKILLHTPDPWQSGRQLLNLVRKIELSVEQHELKSYNKEFPTLLSTFMVSMQCKVAIRVSITLDNNVALASACVMRADALDCVIRFGDTISKLYPNSEQLKQKGHRVSFLKFPGQNHTNMQSTDTTFDTSARRRME